MIDGARRQASPLAFAEKRFERWRGDCDCLLLGQLRVTEIRANALGSLRVRRAVIVALLHPPLQQLAKRLAGMRTSSFIDRIVQDVIAGRYIHLHRMKPEAVDELERNADEMATSIDLLVGRIISDWCVGRMAMRKKK